MNSQLPNKAVPQQADQVLDVTAISELVKKMAVQSEHVILTPFAAECCVKNEIDFYNVVQIVRQGNISNLSADVDQPGAWRFDCYGLKFGYELSQTDVRIIAVINPRTNYIYVLAVRR